MMRCSGASSLRCSRIAAFRSASAARLLGACDGDLRLEDRDEAGLENWSGDVELLVDDRRNSLGVGQLYERSHFRAEDAAFQSECEERVEVRNRLHELYAVGDRRQAPVDLQEGDDAFRVPQVVGERLTADLAVEGVLEEDGPKDAVPVECRAQGDAAAHGLHKVEHLLVGGIGVPGDPVRGQRIGSAAATLVEGGDEALSGANLLQLLLVHGR